MVSLTTTESDREGEGTSSMPDEGLERVHAKSASLLRQPYTCILRAPHHLVFLDRCARTVGGSESGGTATIESPSIEASLPLWTLTGFPEATQHTLAQ